MNLKNDQIGITPTPDFIAHQHTGKFVNILSDTFIIKGAKNDKGFNQAYAIGNRKKEYILIDVVELATREAVKAMVKDGDIIKAIFISGDSVLKDAYAGLETISKDAGGAEIYTHPRNSNKGDYNTRDLTGNDALTRSFGIKIYDISVKKKHAVLLYSNHNGGMLFTGDSAAGSGFDNNWSTFERDRMEKKEDEFAMSKHWGTLNEEFYYLFPRKGKPAVKVDSATRTEILNKLSRGIS